MSQQLPPVRPTPQGGGNNRLWIGIAIGAGGCTLLLVLVCVGLALFGGIIGSRVATEVQKNLKHSETHSWSQAAKKTSLELYEPAYVPGNKKVTIVSMGFGGFGNVVAARYPDTGLSITETDVESNLEITPVASGSSPGESRRKAHVRGANEAYWVTTSGGERRLTLRKSETWIDLAGIGDRQLLRVAESLRPVR